MSNDLPQQLSLFEVNNYGRSKHPRGKTGQVIECERCGKKTYKFKCQLESHKHHFCSRECANKWRGRNKKSLICQNCKKEFVPQNRNYNQKFCSRSCYLEYIKEYGGNRSKNRDISICQNCGREFEHWAGRDRKYCSKDCWSKREGKIAYSCVYCGRVFKDYRSNNRKYCSRSCYNKHKSILMRGKNSPFWEGGRTKKNQLLRNRRKYRKWRKAVFERDNYTCQECGGKSGRGKKVYIHAHHIKHFADYPKSRYKIENGITLCEKCHHLRHSHKF